MSYDSGIRIRQANEALGINANWSASGTALANSSSEWLINVSGAGELRLIRFFSKSANLVCRAYMDTYALVDPLRYRPSQLYLAYGSCGDRGGQNLVKYDTVNSLYIMELCKDFLGAFGYGCDVGVYNDTGAAVNCCHDAIYGINASLSVRQNGVKLDKLEKVRKDERRPVDVLREALANELKFKPRSITLVKACQFDEKAGENVHTLEAFVHNVEEDAGVAQLVKDFLAQFV